MHRNILLCHHLFSVVYHCGSHQWFQWLSLYLSLPSGWGEGWQQRKARCTVLGYKFPIWSCGPFTLRGGERTAFLESLLAVVPEVPFPSLLCWISCFLHPMFFSCSLSLGGSVSGKWCLSCLIVSVFSALIGLTFWLCIKFYTGNDILSEFWRNAPVF